MMKNLLVLCCFLSSSLWAQNINKKAEKFFAEGLSLMKIQRHEEALPLLEKAIDIEPGFGQARIVLGDYFVQQNDFEKALGIFEAGTDILDGTSTVLAYKKGYCFWALGQFSAAKPYFNRYAKDLNAVSRWRKEAEHFLASVETAEALYNAPIPFAPENLGPLVNSEFNEYLPSITADGKQLTFTRLLPDQRGIKQEDFYFSQKVGGIWAQSQAMPGALNTADNEGAQCMSPDGSALFFTACNRQTGYGSCDLYVSVKGKQGWGPAIHLGAPLNTSAWESQPSISPDGKTIIFSSTRSGGYGGKDLWKSSYLGGGKWSEPENLGEKINTKRDESAPFLHFDGQHLYFSSDGWPGMGGQDLFVIDLLDPEAKPKNLGYPINTFHDENGLFVGPDGKMAYYASDRFKGSSGGLDLYQFPLPQSVAARQVVYFKGKILDAKDRKPLATDIQIVALETGDTLMQSASSAAGDYFLVLPADANYGIQVQGEGYLFFSENLSPEKAVKKGYAFETDFLLQAIQPGAALVLNNVFFETGSAELQASSFPELRALEALLKANPEIKVEIGGHTDNQGEKQFNQTLSLSRAEVVKAFLVDQGVDGDRLSTRGYGDSQPIANNESPEGRAKNRRTQITVISN